MKGIIEKKIIIWIKLYDSFLLQNFQKYNFVLEIYIYFFVFGLNRKLKIVEYLRNTVWTLITCNKVTPLL